jgi:hypothetical protein
MADQTKQEILVRDESIAAANKMVEEYKVKVSQITTDKESANKMVEEYKVNIAKALSEKAAADKLVLDTKAIANKAIADKIAADTAVANYKVTMEKAVSDKNLSDKMVEDYKVMLDKANAATDVANKAVADLNAAAALAAKKAIPFGIKSFTTGNAPYTGGASYNLEKHPIKCNGSALSRVKLRTDDVNAQYEYNCTYGGNLGAEFEKTTNLDSAGSGNVIYLDRQGIDCGAGSVLTGMKYVRDIPNDGITYKYSCAPTPGLTCRDVSTLGFSDGSGNFRFLERHDVKCESDEALSSLRVGRPTPTEINYNYKCCKV